MIKDPVREVTPPATPTAAPATVKPILAPKVKGAKRSPARPRDDPEIMSKLVRFLSKTEQIGHDFRHNRNY